MAIGFDITRVLIGSVAVLLLSGTAWSDEGGLPRFVVDRLSAQSGVQTIQRVEGATNVTEWKRNGVTIRQEQNGSTVTSYADDESGKGAVVCSWMVDVELRAQLRTCPSNLNQDLRDDLDEAINAIDGFIVANSLEPTTLDALHVREAAADAKARGPGPASPGPSSKTCSSGETGAMIAAMAGLSRTERMKQVSDLLSVPRWPVSNPCF